MGAPQIITIALMSINLLLASYLHGEPRGNVNFWHNYFSACITVGLLIWGGFFG